MLARAFVLVRIAFANIRASLLNLFVGLVLLFGAALLVVGGSLFATLDDALSRSIIGSVTGHLQVYGARSKDPLEIYGKVDGSDSNLAPIDDFKALKARLLAVPNIARVVPMGASTALISSGNTVDRTLERLRELHRRQVDEATRLPPEEFARRSHSVEAHARNIVSVLVSDLSRVDEFSSADALEPVEREALATAGSAAFWDSFDDDPFGHLELLENRIAPLVADGDMLFIRYLGTDLDAYQASFDRVAIVEGERVPPGHRGVLLPRLYCEEYLKLKNARRLDKIREALEAGRRLSDASDKELQRFVKENQAQTREIALQLDGEATATAVKKLQALLRSDQAELAPLLSAFFAVDDATFAVRYRFFYDELAPMLSLYRVRVGDEMTLRSFGRSGSMETATVRVYGIFELRGLEKSPLASVNALVDIVTFRDLYGFLTAEKKAELDAMKAAAGARQLSRDAVEDELFGGADAEVVQEVAAGAIEADVGRARGGVARRAETYPLSEIDDGVVLNAAILLKDGSRLAQQRTRAEVERLLWADAPPPDVARVADAEAALASGRLPARLAAAVGRVVALERARLGGRWAPATDALLEAQAALKAERPTLEDGDAAAVNALLSGARPRVWVVDWSAAAGFLGKFIDFFRALLLAIVLAFAFIALIVVTIGMTIATLQRTTTIGTMRAIGAQRGFVVRMVLVETVVLALVFGALGAGLGAAVVTYLHATGIPAFRDELYFFFAGPVLRPTLSGVGVLLAVAVTLVVSVVAVLFPLILATRVAPVVAMQASE